jgi:PilZ domain
MEKPGLRREKRRSRRSLINLPLEYRVLNAPHAHGGLVANMSDSGLLVHSVRKIDIGTKLNIAVLFPKGYQLANFEVVAEGVWTDYYREADWEGHQYGLKFTRMSEEDHSKLRQLLGRVQKG